MKGLKKMAAVLACAAIAAGVFAGCGGDGKKDDKAAAGDKVLTVYTARSESLNNLVIPAFEKETGIKVNMIVAGTGPLVKRVASEKDNPQGDVLWAADRLCWNPRRTFLKNMYRRKMPICWITQRTRPAISHLPLQTPPCSS